LSLRSGCKSSSHDAITPISKSDRGSVGLKKEARSQYILPIHHWPRTQKTPFVDRCWSLSRHCFLCEAVRSLPEPCFGDIHLKPTSLEKGRGCSSSSRDNKMSVQMKRKKSTQLHGGGCGTGQTRVDTHTQKKDATHKKKSDTPAQNTTH